MKDKIKKYLFGFSLFMMTHMSFNALMRIAWKEEYENWMQLFFALLTLILVDIITSKVFKK